VRTHLVSAEPGGNDPLEFGASPADTSFQVLGPPVDIAPGSQLVVYNLGSAEADAYVGNNRRTPTATGAALGTVSFSAAGGGFPIDSPDHRFFVVGVPVSFHCAGDGRLTRYTGYGWSATQPTLGSGSFAAAAACGWRPPPPAPAAFFELDAGLANLGSLLIRLTLSRDGESVTLLHQVTVDATP
jgi:MSHA biogenesis protein MshO